MFRNRNFVTLLTGQLVSTFGNNLFGIALPWFVYSVTASKADLSLIGVAQSLPNLASLFTGVFVDRWSKRKTMLSADFIRVVLCVVLMAISVVHASLWPIVLIVFLLQCVGSFFGPAAAAFVPLVVAEEDIPTAMGIEQSGSATAQLVGTLSGGVLLTLLGAPLLFLFDGFSFLVSTVSLLLIRVKEYPAKSVEIHEKRSFFREFIGGIVMFQKSRFLLLTLVAALVVNFATAPFDLVLTAWVKGPMHGSPIQLGIVNAAFFIGVILGGLVLGRIIKSISLRHLFLFSLVIAGICVMGMGLFASVIWDACLTVCIGFVIGSLNGGFSSVVIQSIPASLRGRAFGAIGALFSMMMPVGMAIAGFVMTHTTLTTVFCGMGAMSILSGLTFCLPIREDLQAAFAPVEHMPSQVEG